MAGFDTNALKENERPSYSEIQDFAIHLKIRLGDEAISTADYFIQEHEKVGDVLRAEVWRTVASSIKAYETARQNNHNKVNAIH